MSPTGEGYDITLSTGAFLMQLNTRGKSNTATDIIVETSTPLPYQRGLKLPEGNSLGLEWTESRVVVPGNQSASSFHFPRLTVQTEVTS